MAAQARAELLATLAVAASRTTFTDDETGRLLESAAAELSATGAPDPDSDDARLVEVTRRRWEKSRRVPTELEAEIARASSEGQEAWVAARAASDFKSFAPYLERTLELTRRYVDCHLGHDDFGCAYDVLIDDFEPGIRTARVAELFSELKGELVPMIATVASATPVDDAPLSAHFATDGQRALAREMVGLMGFNEQGWRMDDTVHPFAIRIGARRRADHHPLGRGLLADVAVRRDARVRPRPVRGRDRAGAAAQPDRRDAVARPARVPEPTVGEHGRPRPRVLHGAGAAGFRAGRRRSWRRSTPTACFAPSIASSRPTSGSRPTRRPTDCTSSCGSSSSRI